jgi:hypothetical protein
MMQQEDIILFWIWDKFVFWIEVLHVSQERNVKKQTLGDKLWRCLYINIDCGLIEYSDSIKLRWNR